MKHSGLVTVLISTIAFSGCASLKQPDVKPMFIQKFPPVYSLKGPTAKSSFYFKKIKPGQQVALDASQSVNRQDGKLSYHWQLTKKPQGSGATLDSNKPKTTLTVDSSGDYVARLTVTDSKGVTDSVDVTLSSDKKQLPTVGIIAIGNLGTGDKNQRLVADAMNAICEQNPCDFIIGLGDNIYSNGVDSVKDKQFNTKFETPYKDLSTPFYLTLGNRDNSGVIDGDGSLDLKGDIQVAYAKSTDKPSFHWQMPARFYKINAPVEETKQPALVTLYALDTSLLTSAYDDLAQYDAEKMLARQGKWLEYENHRTKAQWQIAYGHHPYLSNGMHGNAGNYDQINSTDSEEQKRLSGVYVKALIEEYVCDKVQWYLASHDYSMQYLKPRSQCGSTEFIISGAATQNKPLMNPNRNEHHWQDDNHLGFFHLLFTSEQAQVTAFVVDKENNKVKQAYQHSVNR